MPDEAPLAALQANSGAPPEGEELYPSRLNVTLTETLKKRFTERSLEEYSSFEGRRVVKTVRTDGLKLILEDGSWVLFRLSGTEPVCRLYCEAPTQKGLEELAEAARRFLFG